MKKHKKTRFVAVTSAVCDEDNFSHTHWCTYPPLSLHITHCFT